MPSTTNKNEFHDIEINAKFSEALEIMNAGKRNLFVTGRAGTGKSTILRYFRDTTERQIAVLAPTGVAAINIGGETMHSFFGFKPDITIDKARRNAKRVSNGDNAEMYRKLETIVIDEISMVRADLFDCADVFLRVIRNDHQTPFGGTRIIMIGDLYQLPPVVTSNERKIFSHHYKSPYFFDSNVFKEMDTIILELEKVYRQHDDSFIDLLNAVRNNTLIDEDMSALNTRFLGKEIKNDNGFIYLTSLNREASAINERKLFELNSNENLFFAEIEGKFDKKSYPTDKTIALKVGAQIMLLNNDARGRWVNGTIGTVVKMNGNSVTVKLQNEKKYMVEPHTWEMFKFGIDEGTKTITSKTTGTFTQIPVMLAWAVTIHKAQGKTFDKAIIDIDHAFAPGQVYVALSRLTSLNGMVLTKPLKKSSVRIDWRVSKFLTSYRYAISEMQMPLDQKIKIIWDAIEKKKKLNMTYLKANDVKSDRIVKPISVGEMEYRERTFTGMIAFCIATNEQRTFRVDRILSIDTMD